MRIFITGATGVIGTELIKALASNYKYIIALSRHKQPDLKNVKWIQGDLLNMNFELKNCLKEIDLVIHNAASLNSGLTQIEIDEVEKVNIESTYTLLEAISKTSVKKIIYTSGFNIIKKPLPEKIVEGSELDPKTIYARSKYIAEKMIEENFKKSCLDFSILRVSSPITPSLNLMPNTVVKKWIQTSIDGKIIQVYGLGKRTQDFISVSDIANAFLCSIKKPQLSGVFNIASGSPISMLELAQMITYKFGNKYELTDIDENENDRWNINVDKAMEQLSFKPRNTSKEAIMELLNSI
jgi:UDP-glucose 4-epimerase